MNEKTAPVDNRARRKRNASERRAHVAGVGRKLWFVVMVHLPPDANEETVAEIVAEVIVRENIRSVSCNKQALSGSFITGTKKEVTIDAATKDSSKDLVVQFSGEVSVAKKVDPTRNVDIHVRNPLEVELDRDVFVKLRDLFLLLTRALGITNGGGEISLGEFTTALTLTDGKLTSEYDPIVEVNRKSVVTVALTDDATPDMSN